MKKENIMKGFEMKKRFFNKKKCTTLILLIAAVCFVPVIFSACYTPSPLYGSWSDNRGNKISFINDGTFVAKINNSTEIPVTYEGDYFVMDNALIFTVKDPSYSVNTEWDIRGAMLYLDWVGSDKQEVSLTLYHIAK